MTKKTISNNKNWNKKHSEKFEKDPKKKILSMKYKVLLIGILLLFFALVTRIGFLQFVQGSSLKERAYNQQTIGRILSPKRGTIFDSTGKNLALSSDVDTITINPTKITDKTKQSEKEKKEKVAKALSDIFELDYNETLEKVTSTSSFQTIAKKVDQDKVEKLQSWMKDNKILTGINIDGDSKRSYPYGFLASNLIGFCGDDNNGQAGLEYEWNNVLTGTPGKIVTSKDAFQEDIPDKEQTHIPAENGSNLILTVDVNIQTIVEKYLKQAVQDNNCTRGGTVIAMNPSTGDVLAMASYPNYDLNDPFKPNTDYLKNKWDTLTSEEKNTELNKSWKNRLVSDTYEPGSTFKLITAAIALDENITSEDVANDFSCIGYEEINGTKIRCWRNQPHGSQTLRNALQNSCNPSLMQLGKRIGSSTLYKYYDAFGLFAKTDIDLSGEGKGIFFPSVEKIKPIELATMSFGQRVNVTPIELITAVSCIVNDGQLMKPRIVKQVINTDTGAITNIDPINVRQVISKSTSERMRKLMESVVTDGTARTGQVAGYSIGGKTGTSEPPVDKPEEGFIASYVAISPTEKPEICLLLALHDPKAGSHQGGQICGPVVAKMLSEILPYMGLTSSNAQTDAGESNTNSTISNVVVPDIRNKTVTEAIKKLENTGFKVVCSTKGNKNELIVTNQVPKPGTKLPKGSVIILYTSENSAGISVTVPDLIGMSYAQAMNSLNSKNLNINSEGIGIVISQDIAKDSYTEEGTVVKVILQEDGKDIH